MALMNVALILRAGHFYTHHAHNNCIGQSFFSDHSFFGDCYEKFEDSYDATVERIIGSGEQKEVDTIKLSIQAAQKADKLEKNPGTNNQNFFKQLLSIEVTLCSYIEKCMGESKDEGTKNMLAGMADDSMSRQYKIKQRLGGK